MSKIRIGTRQSDLAMTQTNMVAKSFSNQGFETEIIKVVTTGDKDYRAFDKIQGDGFFTKELEKKLLKNEIDIAVHSCKDLPSMVHDDLPWVAFSEREDIYDILITPSENILSGNKLKPNLKIGTSSPRRTAQLTKLFPDCQILQLRGNVPSRIQKAKSTEYDAVVLAEAGVKRLNLLETLKSQGLNYFRLPTVSAPCQGVLAVQMRREDLGRFEFLQNKKLNELAHVEKSILALFGGGCQLALGANIQVQNNSHKLSFYIHDEKYQCDHSGSYSNYTDLLRDTFHQTLRFTKKSQRVWLTQPLQHQLEIAEKFRDTDFLPIPMPLIEIRPCWKYSDFEGVAGKFHEFSSLVFTSRFGVRLFFLEFVSCFPDLYEKLQEKKIFCVGKGTESEFQKYCDLKTEKPDIQTGTALFDIIPESEIPLLAGTQDSELRKTYDKSGRNYTFLSLYKSLKHSSPLYDFTSAQNGDSVVITSPKAAEHFSELYHPERLPLRIFAFGPTTAQKLKSLKIPYIENPRSGSWDSMINEIVNSKN